MKMLYIKHRSGKIMNNFAMSAILAAKELGIDRNETTEISTLNEYDEGSAGTGSGFGGSRNRNRKN